MDAAHVTVAVVVDHPAVRSWLSRIVERHPDLALCGSADTLDEAVALVADRRPDVVVLDDRLRGVPAVIACRRLRSAEPSPAVLFLTSLDDEDAVVVRLLAGAAGAVLRGDDGADVAARVLAAARPATDGSDGVASGGRRVLQQRLGRSGAATQSRARLLALLAEGRSDPEIARALGSSVVDVEVRVLDLLGDLHLDGSRVRTRSGEARDPSPSPARHRRARLRS